MKNPETETITQPYRQRQERLSQVMSAYSLDAVMLAPGPSLEYLTGLKFHLSERPVIAIFLPDRPVFIIHPALESAKLIDLPYPIHAHAYGEEPKSWGASFEQALGAAGISPGMRVGIEPRHLRMLEFNLLKAAAPRNEYVSAEAMLSSLRVQKDEFEISAIRKAVDIAQQALLALLPEIKAGMTEREIAAQLTIELLRAGSEAEMPFSPIVSSGANSANPHAFPSDRRLQAGDLLVIDWGAKYLGYCSDLTRTFAVGKVEPEFRRIAEIILAANRAGCSAARPGIAAGVIDQTARAVIAQAGYGNHFIHRTGHGLGLESHEEPYLYSENTALLAPGMVFTVEPGIYLPGSNGVRIEDNLVITETGAECLSSLPRELQVIG